MISFISFLNEVFIALLIAEALMIWGLAPIIVTIFFLDSLMRYIYTVKLNIILTKYKLLLSLIHLIEYFRTMSKKNKKRINVVYSTNPDFEFQEEENIEHETIAPNKQLLYISLDRKNRGGKEVTLVEGFIGTEEDLKELSKLLKNKFGVGGSVKKSEILIQGNFVKKMIVFLTEKGYRVKQKGGA